MPAVVRAKVKEPGLTNKATGDATVTENGGKSPADKKPRESYEIIVQKNLFSPKRSPIEQDEAAEAPPPVDPDSELMVYGTFIFGTHKSALIKALGGDQKEKAREFGVGETVSQYRIADILEDGVMLEDAQGTSHKLSSARAKKEKRDVRTPLPVPVAEVKQVSVAPPGAKPGPPERQVAPVPRNRAERAAILDQLRRRHAPRPQSE